MSTDRIPTCRRGWIAPALLVVLGGLITPLPGAAQEAAPASEAGELRREIDELKRTFDERLSALERRLAELEGGATPAPQAEEDELAELRAAAREAAGASSGATPAPQEPPAAPAAVGGERNLNRLNPEISITGDALGLSSNTSREDFDARELELNFQSALDPFSLTKWTLAFSPEEGIDIEEAYVSYNGLPAGLRLTAGKFRQSFGLLNRWHLHALPQVDYPLALQSYFGEEGLAQTGVSLSWLVPRPWASANELTFELTDGESEAFGGESFDNLVGLAHLKSFWDVGEAAYVEWGLSGIAGGDGAGGDSRVYGTDFTVHWQPPQRAKYRELTWRTELLRSERDDPEGVAQEAWGGYSYLEGLVARNLYAGLRYDRVEDPLQPTRVRRGLFPSLTWWQSEYVRLRGEYGYLEDDLTGDSERLFRLQLTWAAGPHKHETY